MLFNSVIFLKFFAAFLLLYFLVRRDIRWRNPLIVCASYLFYGWWNYRFLSLLAISSLIDFFVGLKIQESASQSRRRRFLALSIATNLVILGFFKYFDFFARSFETLFERLGLSVHPWTLQIVLPVGISFYTFQSMSYSFDVYRRETSATRNLIDFLAYVSFFPQLVAGPIERARSLLPQFSRTLTITPRMLREGVWLILWGYFKKVVLADNLAPLVDMAYSPDTQSALVVGMGTLAFAFQIYCDFSGYTDIARGLAKILGFELRLNFNLPYLATNLRDFWRRWHISLSTWLRDYLYISLGGNRKGNARTGINLMITMLLGGLWHGAAWHFVLWGFWHGLGLLIHRTWAKPGRKPWRFGKIFAWVITMLFVLYGWLLFRAESWEQVVHLTRALAHFENPIWIGSFALNLFLFSMPVVLMQIWQAKTNDLLAPLSLPLWGRGLLQGILLFGILLYWEKESTPFIYFQF